MQVYCRHSTTSCSENFVVAGTSYEMQEILTFCKLLLSGEDSTSFPAYFWEHAQKLLVKFRTGTRSRPQILSSLL